MIDKETQRIVWNCLPKEFKEEVKKRYNDVLFTDYDSGYRDALVNLFGGYNLASDAEGEEMLMCEKSKVQKLYLNYTQEYISDRQKPTNNVCVNRVSLGARIAMLQELFGSKCLPDACNVASSDVASSDVASSDVASSEPKPAEPKFKRGDKVKIVGGNPEFIGKVVEIEAVDTDGVVIVYLANAGHSTYKAKYLEPYTESNTANSSNPQSDSVENLRNRGEESANALPFGDRLKIAAMAMQGILSNTDILNKALQAGEETLTGDDISFRAVAQASFAFADALIAESNLPIN